MNCDNKHQKFSNVFDIQSLDGLKMPFLEQFKDPVSSCRSTLSIMSFLAHDSLVSKLFKLKFLKYSFFYAGLYCICLYSNVFDSPGIKMMSVKFAPIVRFLLSRTVLESVSVRNRVS